MRKIVSKHKEEKNKKRNAWIVGIILIGIMIFSTLGYAFNGIGTGSSEINYKGFKVVNQDGLWFLEKGESYFIFTYNPKDIEISDSEIKKIDSYKNKVLYISSENIAAESEIYTNIVYQNQIVLRMQNACLEDEKCEGDLPIKNCDDNFIIIKENSNNKITQKENCVFIEGDEENLLKLTDEFLLKTLEIA